MSTPDFTSADPDAIRPSLTDVALLVADRTQDEYGNFLVDFTDKTRPTADQVNQLIDAVIPRVTSQFPPEYGTEFYDQVSHTVSLWVAMEIDTSFYGERIEDNGRVRHYWDMIRESVRNTNAAIDGATGAPGSGTHRVDSIVLTTNRDPNALPLYPVVP